jgi:hypothetical protein
MSGARGLCPWSDPSPSRVLIAFDPTAFFNGDAAAWILAGPSQLTAGLAPRLWD